MDPIELVLSYVAANGVLTLIGIAAFVVGAVVGWLMLRKKRADGVEQLLRQRANRQYPDATLPRMPPRGGQPSRPVSRPVQRGGRPTRSGIPPADPVPSSPASQPIRRLRDDDSALEGLTLNALAANDEPATRRDDGGFKAGGVENAYAGGGATGDFGDDGREICRVTEPAPAPSDDYVASPPAEPPSYACSAPAPEPSLAPEPSPSPSPSPSSD